MILHLMIYYTLKCYIYLSLFLIYFAIDYSIYCALRIMLCNCFLSWFVSANGDSKEHLLHVLILLCVFKLLDYSINYFHTFISSMNISFDTSGKDHSVYLLWLCWTCKLFKGIFLLSHLPGSSSHLSLFGHL